MDAKAALFGRELAALKSIDDYFVGTDYWEDETIRLYRGLGLVRTDGKRIKLSEAGMKAIERQSLLSAASSSRAPHSPGASRVWSTRSKARPCCC